MKCWIWICGQFCWILLCFERKGESSGRVQAVGQRRGECQLPWPRNQSPRDSAPSKLRRHCRRRHGRRKKEKRIVDVRINLFCCYAIISCFFPWDNLILLIFVFFFWIVAMAMSSTLVGSASPSAAASCPSANSAPMVNCSSQFMLIDTETYSKTYRIGHDLGKGGFGTVYAGIRVRDGLAVAIKHIHKSSVTAWSHVSLRFSPFNGRQWVALLLQLTSNTFRHVKGPLQWTKSEQSRRIDIFISSDCGAEKMFDCDAGRVASVRVILIARVSSENGPFGIFTH